MSGLNKVIMMARLVRDPDLQHTSTNGTPVVNLLLAINENYKGEQRAHFFEATAFGRTAELIAEHLTKGQQAIFDGRLQQDRWESSEGEPRSRVKVIIREFSFLGNGRKTEDSNGNSNTEEPQEEQLAPVAQDEDEGDRYF